MKCLQFIRRHRFWLLLLAAFLALDLALAAVVGPYWISSGRFLLNDFEVVRRDHPEEVWDRVFFGNSIVISAYLEEESQSDYVNLGIDYGVVQDLWDMIRKKEIHVGSELVIGLNDLTLYDDFPTNPAYPWHRKALEPFCYFHRDRLKTLFTETVSQALTGFTPAYGAYATQERAYYYGSLSQAELDEKVAASPYMDLPEDTFDKNFRALEQLADYCQKNGIRLRIVWMPLNPDFTVPASTRRVFDRTEAFCRDRGLVFYDMSDALEASCFYDIGHLNHEYGAHVFTREMDPWLLS